MVEQIKNKAKEENVPIMQDDGIKFLTDYIENNSVKQILEIGTAVGYSAICMANISKDIKIVSIERDEERYLEAVENVKKMNLENQITLIYKDALEVELDEKFDLIFIDAAKGKNIEFFEKFEKNLEKNGTIITDNINFHGFTNMPLEEIKSKNLRSLIKKIRKYITYLKENTTYQTIFYDIGDGLSVTTRKEDR